MNNILTIQIVGWNSARHLERAASALRAVPRDQVSILYIDNASHDNSIEIVRSILPHARILILKENKGFAGAHNAGFLQCETPFVVTHDPDVELNWHGIEKLLKAFEDDKLAAIQGKLLRKEDGSIDSAGIVLDATLNGIERGAGEKDKGEFNNPFSIIAVTGACGLYRLQALKEVGYFDDSFFSYKEDVDLGWRLTNAGWKVLYKPIIVGTHSRTLGKRGRVPWVFHTKGVQDRLRDPRTRYSLRNYVWMLVKNMSAKQALLHSPFIIARLFYFFFLTLAHPPLFGVWKEIVQGLPEILEKRRTVR